MQRVLRKSSPASDNQISQASLPTWAGALFSCRLSSFWQSAGLQNHRPLVRIRPPSLREGYYKTETPVPGSDTGVLGGRGWITRAALLKTAHWAVFAPSSVTGPQLFESARMKTQTFCKQKTASVSLRWRSFYGRGWIRTTEAEKQQIYSLSPLATREHAHILFSVIADCLYILSSEVAFVNYFFHGFSLFLSFSIFLRFTAIKALSITAKDPKTFSVLRSFWSW